MKSHPTFSPRSEPLAEALIVSAADDVGQTFWMDRRFQLPDATHNTAQRVPGAVLREACRMFLVLLVPIFILKAGGGQHQRMIPGSMFDRRSRKSGLIAGTMKIFGETSSKPC